MQPTIDFNSFWEVICNEPCKVMFEWKLNQYRDNYNYPETIQDFLRCKLIANPLKERIMCYILDYEGNTIIFTQFNKYQNGKPHKIYREIIKNFSLPLINLSLN